MNDSQQRRQTAALCDVSAEREMVSFFHLREKKWESGESNMPSCLQIAKQTGKQKKGNIADNSHSVIQIIIQYEKN